MKDDQAFPATHGAGQSYSPGLARRELFAAMAMQGYVTAVYVELIKKPHTPAHGTIAPIAAQAAVDFADALIRELDK